VTVLWKFNDFGKIMSLAPEQNSIETSIMKKLELDVVVTDVERSEFIN
jgi:hypothetical protein